MLHELCGIDGAIWIISVECARAWALLQLWEGIEHGAVALADDYLDATARQARASAKCRRNLPDPLGAISGSAFGRELASGQGYCVLEDAPNIIRCQLRGTTPWITWVDSRNYGVERDVSVAHGHDTCAWLARFVSAYIRYMGKYQLGSMQATAGSQAMHGFRHGHYKGGIHVHTEPSALATESASHHGGRAEAYRIGVAPSRLRYLDFRAQYPHVCRTHPMPVRYCGPVAIAGYYGATGRAERHDVTATVTLETEEPAYPYLRDGITIYPVGRFRTTLCGPELHDAEAHDRVVEYHEIHEYEMDTALSGYAQSLYNARVQAEAESDKQVAAALKRIANCLHGKFGQRQRQWVMCPEVSSEITWGEEYGQDSRGKLCRYRYLGGVASRELSGGYSPDSVPAIAAWVCSAGRMALLGAIRSAGWGNVYYCDTDAIMVNDNGYERLSQLGHIQEGVWGALGVRWGPSAVDIRGIKHYLHDGNIVCAGLPRGAIHDAGDGFHYVLQESPRTSLRHRAMPNYRERMVSYARASEYRHGQVLSDGTVIPWRIEG